MSETLDLVLGWAGADGHLDVDATLAEAVALGCYVARLAAADHEDIRVIAVRDALEIDDARRAEHRRLREASFDVHAGLPRGGWRRLGEDYPPVSITEQRRAERVAAARAAEGDDAA